ncbi:NaeI family type II restriction endonuclease [Catellatospora paridis]|uniref:NaeI family type II restriction endonuclease n=1 Tax=Catellatospora paridis TaxID=1617086 RepID=UPI0018AF7183|nr:NaeI family type II restriction endonuclease [Catellatospora paridis]
MHSDPGLFEISRPIGPRADGDGLAAVEGWFRAQPGMASRFALALRQSIDEVLDGQRTGRFDVATLEKTEKTYLGTKVEIVVRAEFGLARGESMDYRVAGCDVDAKFTIGRTWTIPREAMGHVCLVMAADDLRSRFRVGLLRITEQVLTTGQNQDGKRAVSLDGRGAISWLVVDAGLPENVLLQLPPTDREAIFSASDGHRGSGNGGQLRINELLRRVHGRMIDRTTAITVASQLDGPKRVRDARHLLRDEGVIVLGHQNDHPRIARALQLPVPPKGSWIATRLVTHPAGDQTRAVVIGGQRYAVARPGEPSEPGPTDY